MEWDIQKLFAYVGIAYFISWGFFFVTLPLFVSFFGKVKGSVVAYGVSWLVMLAVPAFIQKYNGFNKQVGKELDATNNFISKDLPLLVAGEYLQEVASAL